MQFMSKGKETNLSQVTCLSFITSLISFFDLKNYTKVDCAFHYWDEQRLQRWRQVNQSQLIDGETSCAFSNVCSVLIEIDSI